MVLARLRPRNNRRWLVALAMILVIVMMVAGGSLLLLLAVTPSASSAPARVAAILASHSAPSDGGVVPARVATALLATEDSRFRSDWAIDPQGAMRAVWGLMTNDPNYGGATIEVQLAKMLWTPKRSDPIALAEQVAMAVKLDHDFSKTAILAMYLDAAYFGDGAYGVTAAAEHYFGVGPDQLTWGQATLLAGLVQAPSSYDPHGHLHNALARRNHVLRRMVATGAMSAAEAKAVADEALNPTIAFYG